MLELIPQDKSHIMFRFYKMHMDKYIFCTWYPLDWDSMSMDICQYIFLPNLCKGLYIQYTMQLIDM